MTAAERPRHYATTVIRAGALIPESLALLGLWRPDDTVEPFRNRVVAGNLLGKATRRRVREILKYGFVPRFLGPGAPPIDAARRLILSIARDRSQVVAKTLLFHTALADDLFYDFVAEELTALRQAGRSQVGVDDARAFIERLARAGAIAPPWNDEVSQRTAGGLLTTARDFGLLEGVRPKRLAPSFLPFETFVYVLYCLQRQGITANRVAQHPHWRLFQVQPAGVETLLVEADHRRLVRYRTAGAITRIDWLCPDLEGALDVLAA